MSKSEDIRHSVLIVSAQEEFESLVRRSLRGFVMVDFRKNAAAARRCMLERYFDLIVADLPLPDEAGIEFALDAASQSRASILLVVPASGYEDIMDQVTDQGILVLARPMPRGRMDKAIRFLLSVQNRMQQMEKKIQSLEEKMEDLRIISRARFLLGEKRHVTEEQAHRYLGRQAMNHGVSRRRIAQRVIEELE